MGWTKGEMLAHGEGLEECEEWIGRHGVTYNMVYFDYLKCRNYNNGVCVYTVELSSITWSSFVWL